MLMLAEVSRWCLLGGACIGTSHEEGWRIELVNVEHLGTVSDTHMAFGDKTRVRSPYWGVKSSEACILYKAVSVNVGIIEKPVPRGMWAFSAND
jgi:hypothetical protein